MNKYQASTSAAGIALARAIESQKPEGVRICYDPYAREMIGPLFWYVFRLFVVTGYAEMRSPGVMGFLVVRERYIDDQLKAALEGGIDQLVILGAGYDTRAYHMIGLEENVRVFEVDHPATQQLKKEKLVNLLGSLPEHVTFVPVDFDRESLGDQLAFHGYDYKAKSLFIWQGVTLYLTPEAVDNTLDFVAHCSGAGSRIVFDYMYTSLLNGTVKRGEVASMRRAQHFTGEALKFGIPEGTICDFLEQRGFVEVVNADCETLKRLYFQGPNANRTLAVGYAIATGMVSGEKPVR
jgi:methyltransferase (TIGR00027 family)